MSGRWKIGLDWKLTAGVWGDPVSYHSLPSGKAAMPEGTFISGRTCKLCMAKIKQIKRSRYLDFENDSDSDESDGPSSRRKILAVERRPHAETWPRFLILRSTSQTPANRIHPFLMGKTLESVAGRVEAKPMKSGDILIECSRKRQSENLRGLQSVGEWPVEITAHPTLNICKGVVRDQALAELDDSELINELKSQGVSAVRRFTKKTNGKDVQLPTVILTFSLPKLPERIWAGYYFLRVTPWVPLPLRCFKCQRFGHGSQKCRSNSDVCWNCGSKDHEGQNCSAPPKCVNCVNGAHPSRSRDCPKWKEECLIQKIRSERKISFLEAKKVVSVQNSIHGMPSSYASVASANAHANTSVHTMASQIKKVDFSCQVEISDIEKGCQASASNTDPSKTPKISDMPVENTQAQVPKTSGAGLGTHSQRHNSSTQGAGSGVQSERQTSSKDDETGSQKSSEADAGKHHRHQSSSAQKNGSGSQSRKNSLSPRGTGRGRSRSKSDAKSSHNPSGPLSGRGQKGDKKALQDENMYSSLESSESMEVQSITVIQSQRHPSKTN